MYDLEEQEKVDALKAWWNQNQRSVMSIVIVAALSYSAVSGWKYWKQQKAEQAAEAFANFQKLIPLGDPSKLLNAAQGMEQSSPGSAYTSRAALAAAQQLVGAGKTAEAQAQYEWVMAHADEPALQSLARIRLSGILADNKKYPESIALLEKEIDPAFLGMASDLRGDILLAQGKNNEAREAYRAALSALEGNHPLRQVVQLKADALGGGNEPAKADSAAAHPEGKPQ